MSKAAQAVQQPASPSSPSFDHRRASSEGYGESLTSTQSATLQGGGTVMNSVSTARTLFQAASSQELRRAGSEPQSLIATSGSASGVGTGRSLSDNTPVPKSNTKGGLNKLYDQLNSGRETHRSNSTISLAGTSGGASLPSASTLSLPLSTSSTTFSGNSFHSLGSVENPWQVLHVYVLPLFNGEPLGRPIEDLNSLVNQHIEVVVSRGFSRALSSLETDITELLNSGMLTMSAKIEGFDDDQLLVRVLEIWCQFFDHVLPYIEGVFLPVHTNELIKQLHRPRQAGRATSPAAEKANTVRHIDVRQLTLRSFRDQVIHPLHIRLFNIFTTAKRPLFAKTIEDGQPRIQQMLLVLVSISCPGFCLNVPISQTTSPDPEQSVLQLLRALRRPTAQQSLNYIGTGMPSFMSAGAPGDRRGRLAWKSVNVGGGKIDEEEDGGATPRNATGMAEGEREREFLASLRSPDLPEQHTGLGLGIPLEGDDGSVEWHTDEVEATLGLKAGEVAQDGRRRGAS